MLWVNSRIITFGTKKQETLRSVNAPRPFSKRGPKVRTNNTRRQNRIDLMEQTLVILKPSAVERCLIGEIITRIQDKGLIISGMKMMQLDEKILREHYAHLVDRPFFPSIVESMTASPVIVMCLKGVDAVSVFRQMTGVTNGRNAVPGTLRGDFCMSGQANIIHASDSVENARIEISRFFSPSEIFDYIPANLKFLYSEDELKA